MILISDWTIIHPDEFGTIIKYTSLSFLKMASRASQPVMQTRGFFWNVRRLVRVSRSCFVCLFVFFLRMLSVEAHHRRMRPHHPRTDRQRFRHKLDDTCVVTQIWSHYGIDTWPLQTPIIQCGHFPSEERNHRKSMHVYFNGMRH